MLLSLALIIIVGFALAEIFQKLKMPRIIGMIIAGIILGPELLNLISPTMLTISPDIRKIALAVIIMRAGLSLDIRDLKKIGLPAFLMAFIPSSFEMVAITFTGPLLLNFTLLQSALLGTVVAAVSPAVIVSKMIKLMEKGQGTDKQIPQLLLAGASVEDIYVIVAFQTMLGLIETGTLSDSKILLLPVSLLSGAIIGGAVGLLLALIFKKFHVRDTGKILVIFSLSLLFMAFESAFPEIPFSGLLAIIALGVSMSASHPIMVKRLIGRYEKLWVSAELLLFVLVGVSISFTGIGSIILPSLGLLLIGLSARSIGVYLSLAFNRSLNWKERLFIVLADIPKATVQASIASIPLEQGVTGGAIIMAIAIIAVLITTPLGTALIDWGAPRLLKQKDNSKAPQPEA